MKASLGLKEINAFVHTSDSRFYVCVKKRFTLYLGFYFVVAFTEL